MDRARDWGTGRVWGRKAYAAWPATSFYAEHHDSRADTATKERQQWGHPSPSGLVVSTMLCDQEVFVQPH